MNKTGCMLMTLLALNSSAKTMVEQNIHLGEALFLTLPDNFQGCNLVFQHQQHPIFAHPVHNELSVVLLAADLDSTNKDHRASVQCKNRKQPLAQIAIHQIEPDYPVEPLSVNPDLVTPPAHAKKRIDRERGEIKTALVCKEPEKPLKSAFSLPVPLTKVTSPFGIRRLYNNQIKSRHTGVDFRAAEGTPVCAPHSGTVRMAQDNWYTGGHIILEHGWGVNSSYFHLSELQVKPGDKVEQGQQIALTGATGRVTGPHLHWGIHIHGIPVSPVLFMLDSVKLFSEFKN